MEILSATLKNETGVSGLNINNSEYLDCLYADDTSIILEDDANSLEKCLEIFDHFGNCAGLRANLEKNSGCMDWLRFWMWC